MSLTQSFSSDALEQNDMGSYVAEMQLHMTLQARHLVPNLNTASASDRRLEMLQQVQASAERSASRQWL